MAVEPGPLRPVRVMIVDDSIVIRSIIERILKTDSAIEVCGHAGNGEQAVNMVQQYNPDVIVLDIEMPIMDGITAIPLLLAKKPGVRILMCSTLSERGAAISIQALSLGAADCVLKPSGSGNIRASDDFHRELLRMVKLIGGAATKPALPQRPVANLRADKPGLVPNIVAIGSSTGGPNALAAIMPHLKGLPVPMVITQHMPRTFTRTLANHLTRISGVECHEGENGMLLRPGCAYVAPGGYHMLFKKTAAGTEIQVDDGPMENFCKPSVDPMLRSLCRIYGSRILMVMLTGMGEDGLPGSRTVTESGGHIIAQDAATSVVWGMPGAVANAGICSAVLPLMEIPSYILRACGQHARPSTLQSGGAA